MNRDKDERKNIYTVVETFSLKKVLRYRFFLLLMFFIFIGIVSFFFLSNEAERLAGGKRYSQLSSDSYKGGSFNLIERIKYAISSITSNENLLAKKDDVKNGNEDYDEEGISLEDENNNFDLKSKNNKTFNDFSAGINKRSSQGLSAGTSFNKNNFESDLTPLSSLSSEGVSKTSLSSFDLSRNPAVKIKTNEAKIGISYGKKTEEDKTAMSLLKSTFKTTIMAARDASNDTARAWTSKAFDYSVESKQTIEYDEKLRASLDRINPNSIPAFLKDPSLDPESMKSLKVAEVPGLSSEDENRNKFDFDMDSIKSQIQDYKDKKQDLLSNLSNINPLFNMNSSQQDLTDEEIDQKSGSVNLSNPNTLTKSDGTVITQPSDPPKLGSEITNVTTDEYGYIRVTQSDGTIQIFDPDSGKILGCEVPSAGMCVLPGADNCPKDIYFI